MLQRTSPVLLPVFTSYMMQTIHYRNQQNNAQQCRLSIRTNLEATVHWNFGWRCELFRCLVQYILGLLNFVIPVYTWSAELCYTAIADFMSCKEFGGHGHHIHFCDHTNLIGNGKDAFVSICQNH